MAVWKYASERLIVRNQSPGQIKQQNILMISVGHVFSVGCWQARVLTVDPATLQDFLQHWHPWVSKSSLDVFSSYTNMNTEWGSLSEVNMIEDMGRMQSL